jgi:SAM-dependent methyltransferase
MPAGTLDGWPDDYELGRPGWPAEVADVPGVEPAATVLELAAGTGKLTRVLVRTFAHVIAVEPADAMRRLLEVHAPGAERLAASAESIPLADAAVACVFVAEAFNHFDVDRALAEIERVLRPGGGLVLMWNLPSGPWDPSIAAVEELLDGRIERLGSLSYDPLDLGSAAYSGGAWKSAFARSAFGALHEITLPNPHVVDRAGLVAFLASMGWIADLPDEERLPLLHEVRASLTADEYRRTWETHVYWTTRP